MDRTLLDEILEPELFELERRARRRRRTRSRAAAPALPDWKCIHKRKSGWIPLDDPRILYKAVIPGKTRVDNAAFSPIQAADVNMGAIGQDERRPWTNTLDRPYRWICKLGIVLQSRKGGRFTYAEGTGVLIGNRHVLTAAHNLVEPVFNNASKHVDTLEARAVVVIPGLNGVHKDPKRVMPFGWSWGGAFRTTTGGRDLICRRGRLLYGHDFAGR